MSGNHWIPPTDAAEGTILPALRGAALLAGLGLMLPAAAAGDCSEPARPDMPDGARATMEQMLEGQKGVKAFQASNMQYMKCLEKQFTAAQATAKRAGAADARALANAEYNEAIEAYNAAVSAEEEVAGAFNIELREYKAANK